MREADAPVILDSVTIVAHNRTSLCGGPGAVFFSGIFPLNNTLLTVCFLRFIPTFAPFSLFHSITSITTFILHYHDTIYVPDVRDFSNRAVELAESSQYDEVLDLVNNGIKPDTGNANAMRVNALAPQGKFPLATTSFVMIPVYEKG